MSFVKATSIDDAIQHCLDVVEEKKNKADKYDRWDEWESVYADECIQCATDYQQLAEWLTELKEAKGIIRVCNRVLGYLLECEIENTSTRHEVETLLKNITEYLSGGSENDT